MRIDKLTVKAQEALMTAQGTAAEMGHAAIGPLDLLDALLKQERGLAAALLEKVGIPTERIGTVVTGELKRLPSQSSGGAWAWTRSSTRCSRRPRRRPAS